MQSMIRYTLIPLAVLALAACDPMSAGFNTEAGASIDDGNFGAATQRNILVHSGEIDFSIAMTEKFAADVQNTVNFEFDSAMLDEESMAILREQAAWIRQFPDVRFRVYGHTDLVGSESYNRALGQRRAEAAVAYLTGQGISRERLEAVASFGETRPLVYTEGPERANRRTVTEVSGLVGRRPTNLDGKYAEVIYNQYIGSASAPHPVAAPALSGD